MYTSGESSSHSGSEELDNLLLSELVDLFWSESSEAVLVETFLFFLDCCHVVNNILI